MRAVCWLIWQVVTQNGFQALHLIASPSGLSDCSTKARWQWNHRLHFSSRCNEKCDLLTHWGRVTHICVSKLTIIGSDNGLSPGRRQAIIWTNAGILLIRTSRTNFEIHTFSFKKMHLKMSSGKWRPFCLGLNELKLHWSIHLSVHLSQIMIVYTMTLKFILKIFSNLTGTLVWVEPWVN